MNRYTRYTLVWIGALLLCKIICSYFLELGNDEVYYRLYADHLAWSYFDHPPMVGWMIRLTTFNLNVDSELFVRLGSLICGSLTLWIIYLCGKQINNEKAGFLSAIMFGSTTYSFLISGLFILPDSPQMFFWSLSLLTLIRFIQLQHDFKRSAKYIIWFGVFSGLGMMSKIHTAFLWAGFIMYILFQNRQLLRNGYIYLSALITITIFSPAIWWTISEHFITYSYHGARISHFDKGIRLETLFAFIAGQLIYANPLLIPLWFKSIIKYYRSKVHSRHKLHAIFLYTSLPLLFLLIFSSLFNNTLPHWAGPSYVSLSVLTGYHLSFRTYFTSKKLNWKLLITWPLFVFLTLPVFVLSYPGTVGLKQPGKMGKGDPSIEMYGWKKAAKILFPLLDSMKQRHPGLTIIGNKWFPAAHIEEYIARPNQIQVICLGPPDQIHQYYFLNDERKPLKTGDTALFIMPSNNPEDPSLIFKNNFRSVDYINRYAITRGGKTCKYLFVYRLNFYLKYNDSLDI